MPSITEIRLLDASDITLRFGTEEIDIDLAIYKILQNGQSWYNKYGFENPDNDKTEWDRVRNQLLCRFKDVELQNVENGTALRVLKQQLERKKSFFTRFFTKRYEKIANEINQLKLQESSGEHGRTGHNATLEASTNSIQALEEQQKKLIEKMNDKEKKHETEWKNVVENFDTEKEKQKIETKYAECISNVMQHFTIFTNPDKSVCTKCGECMLTGKMFVEHADRQKPWTEGQARVIRDILIMCEPHLTYNRQLVKKVERMV